MKLNFDITITCTELDGPNFSHQMNALQNVFELEYFRCQKPGHYIANCPTNGDPAYEPKKLRTPLGLPLSHLYKSQDGSSSKGNLVTTTGEVALLRPSEDVFVKELALI